MENSTDVQKESTFHHRLYQTLGSGKEFSHSQVKAFLNAFAITVQEACVEKGHAQIPNLGRFSLSERAPSVKRNPKTGESVNVGASVTLSFRPTKAARKEMLDLKKA